MHSATSVETNSAAPHVLVVAATPFFTDRGTPIRIFEEIRALAELGRQITVATYHIGDTPTDLPANVHIIRIPRLALWYRKRSAGASPTKFLLNIQLIWLAFRLLRRESLTLIHAHNHEGLLVAALARFLSRRTHVPLIGDLHGSLTEELLPSWSPRVFTRMIRMIERCIERRADHIITSSAENTLRVQQSLPQMPVSIVRDGAFTHSAFPENARGTLLARLNITDQDAIILTYAGGMGTEKGTDLLAELAPDILHSNPKIHLLIASTISESEQARWRELLPSPRLHLLSPLSYHELPLILKGSDIALDLKPASSHQASGKLLNAMAAGIPVIAFERAMTRALLTGIQLLGEYADRNTILQAIATLAADTDLREEYGQENAERALSFSWQSVGQEIDAIYKSLIE